MSEAGKNYRALLNILQNFEVKKIIMKDVNELKGKTESIIIEKKITVERMNDIKEISGFGTVKIYLMQIDSGSALKINYGKNSFLFMGKTEEEEELGLVKVYNEGLKSDVLKVAKYGSDKSTSLEFIMKVKPEVSVISTVGIKERDLPSKYVVRRLEMINSKVYRTDEDGAVVLTSDRVQVRK